MAFWHGMHLDDLLKRDADRTAIMAKWLPRLIDEYFVKLQAAVHGAYQLEHKPVFRSAAEQANYNLNVWHAQWERLRQGKR